MHSNKHLVTIEYESKVHRVYFSDGENLRKGLLQRGFNPYGKLSRKINCKGNGICATCGVWIKGKGLAPKHWHDAIAKKFGYPRLSCQIKVNAPIHIVLLNDKWIWGKVFPDF